MTATLWVPTMAPSSDCSVEITKDPSSRMLEVAGGPLVPAVESGRKVTYPNRTGSPSSLIVPCTRPSVNPLPGPHPARPASAATRSGDCRRRIGLHSLNSPSPRGRYRAASGSDPSPSILVGGGHFSECPGAQGVVDPGIDRLLDEPDRAVRHGEIGPSGVEALERQV